MKALTKISIGFLALAAAALWFTSCSSEDVAQNGGSLNEKDQRVLLLSVNTGNLGTRADNTTALTPEEMQINDMTVGIYDKTGNYRVVAKLASKTDAADDGKEASGSTEGYFKKNTSGVKVKVVTSTLQKDDQVLVAVNRGTAAFTSKPNSPTDFSKETMDAVTALTGSAAGTTIDATKFPKFGTANLPAGSSSTFSATVNVKNLVSKVTLEGLKVEFSNPGPYANASFTPSEIFLLNVPNKLAFSATGQASTSTTDFAYLNGTGMAKLDGTSVTKKDVLAKTITVSSALTGSSTASFTGQPILYTIPNSNSTSNKTILVIAGNFKKDGSGAGETVYYPLALNENYDDSNPSGAAADGGTKSQTLAGKNYKCTVVIKTIGANNPWVTTGPQTAELTVNVENWEDANQTTTFE